MNGGIYTIFLEFRNGFVRSCNLYFKVLLYPLILSMIRA